jgi:hypothetical protein
MSDPSLKQAHNQLLEEGLYKIREQEPVLAGIISYRLVIERLGEKGNNYWWDSQVLSEFGGDSLSEVTPKTAPKRRVKLAQRVGEKVENERLPDGSLSLFNLTPRIENRIDERIEDGGIKDIEALESLEAKFNEPGWSAEMVPVESKEVQRANEIELGSLDTDTLESDREVERIVQSLVDVYGQSTENNLRVPYYVREG